ncbi:MAG: phytoene desaturase family protein [Cytophaga sp.]|uniref:phytoene desaturase family protein n=1 Tax=Cytophaga sp. TaxID=29535 RepID=UPI003F81D34F
MKTIGIIGSGISGLCAAAVLARKGQQVLVFEKNDQLGGRMRQFEAHGFTFDMGPSWYWMPDVFERFYEQFGYSSSDFYELKKLDPGFQIITSDGETLKIPAGWEELLALFEQVETGAADKLRDFMHEAEYKYNVGVKKLIYKPGLSLLELINADTVSGMFRLQVFSSFSKHVRRYFKNEKLIALMEFPVLFLGAMPENTPALYSLMNYAGLKQGTFYPMGGFKKVIDALVKICREQGVVFKPGEEISGIEKLNRSQISLTGSNGKQQVDGLIAAADYHHVESKLLREKDRNYNEAYWDKKTFAPSSLIFYIGLNCQLEKLEHHNLFFDADFARHATEIYQQPQWPDDPLFYVCCPSKTDPAVAPAGKENLFILMPIAPGLIDEPVLREAYYYKLMDRLESYTGMEIRKNIEYMKSYCVKDFITDYHSYKGNAYGLANTLTQTANLKPKIKNNRIPNFYYCGQLTVPGPGVPPSIVSGQVAATELLKKLNVNV